jgi:ribosomal protein S18 acetylase RimI-like enzyme
VALNEYDSLLVKDKAPAGNEYDAMLGDLQTEKTGQMAGAMHAAAEIAPDFKANALKLSKEYSLPVEVVERNYDDLVKKKEAYHTDYESILKKTPKLAEWIADPNNAALSKDDLKALGKLHENVNEFEENSGLYNALYSGLNRFNEGLAKTPQFIGNLSLIPSNIVRKSLDMPQVSYGTENELASYYAGNAQKAEEATPLLHESVTQAISDGEYARAGKSLFLQLAHNAPTQMALLASSYLGAPAAGLSLAGLTSGAQKSSELSEKGYDPLAATSVGASVGTIEAGFESLGTMGILAKWEGAIAKGYGKEVSKEVMKDFAKTMAYSFAAEGNEEFLTSLAQDFTEYASGVNPEATRGMLQRAMDAGILGAASGGLMVGPSGAMQGMQRMKVANQVRANQEFYQALGNGVDESKLKQRMPEKMKEYVEKLTKDGPLENVFIPLAAMEQYFQEKGASPVKMAGELGILEEYQAAKEIGVDVKIPTSKMAEKIAGTEHYQALVNDIKFDPEQLTANELAAERDEARRRLEAEQKDVAENEETIRAQTAEQESAEIGKSVGERLKEIGIRARDAKTYGQLYERMSLTMSQRLGITPKEFFGRYGVRINNRQVIPGEGESATMNEGEVLNQYGQERPPRVQTEEDGSLSINEDGVKASGSFMAEDGGIEDFINPDGIYTDVVDLSKEGLDQFERPFQVDDIAVNPSMRRSGEGTRALRDLESAALSEGADAVFLNASPTGTSNKEAELEGLIKFYEKNGYKVIRKSEGNAEMYKPLALAEYNQTRMSPLGFYSLVENEIEKMSFKEMPAKDLMGRIKNIQGVKKEELESLGLEDFLNLKEGKVSKEEVLEFVRNNGVQVEQIMLGKKENDDGSEVGFTEPEFVPLSEIDRYAYDDAVESEVDDDIYEKEDSDRYKQIVESLRDEYTDEETGKVDESALEDAAVKKFTDELYESRSEYIDSEDYYGARYRITEKSTGFELIGNDDIGWYSSDLDKHYDGYAEEAKIKFFSDLIDNGDIDDGISQKDLIKPSDVKWSRPVPSYPSDATITKKAKALLKDEPARMRALSEERNSMFKDDPDEFLKEVENDLLFAAKEEVRVQYEDVENEKNKFKFNITNGYPNGFIFGSKKSGYKFTLTQEDADGNDQETVINLEAKTIELAKEEALRHLVDKGVISPEPEQKPEADEANGINKIVGKSNWQSYTVPGEKSNYRELLLTLPKTEKTFTYDTHFRGYQNFMAHVRISDRIDENGKKTLFIEEIQSDWHQQGRERGYKDENYKRQLEEIDNKQSSILLEMDSLGKKLEAEIDFKAAGFSRVNLFDAIKTSIRAEMAETFSINNDIVLDEAMLYQELNQKLIDLRKQAKELAKHVPDAPFKQTDAWASLAIKRIIRLAAEENYDAISWTPAEIHVERWGTDHVSWVKNTEESYVIVDERGQEIKNLGIIKDKRLAELTLERLTNPDYLQNVENSLIAKGFDVDFYRERHDYASMMRVAVRDSLIKKSEADQYLSIKNAKQDAVTTGMKVKKLDDFWLVGSAEQRGGNADGMDIEEVARARGELLERNGERVTNRDELKDVIASTLGREKTDRSLNSLTDRVWKKMQAGDSPDSKTGVIEPRKEGMQFFYDKLLPDVVKNILKKTDKSTKIEVTTVPGTDDLKALSFEITPQIKKIALEQGFSLFQPGQDGPLGKIEIGANSINIALLKGADRSTFIHETGHFMLEVLKDVSSQENVPDSVKEDVKALTSWLGVEDLSQVGVDQHEQFARGFEAYLMEGKAPSKALAKAFARFKLWLTDIYKTIKGLDVELTPEVRDVFDRLVASQDEINAAKGKLEFKSVFGDPSKAGLSEKEQLEYLNAIAWAEMDAKEQLDRKLIEEVNRKADQKYKKKFKELYDVEMAKAKELLPFRVLDAIKSDLKLSTNVMREQYPAFADYVPHGTMVLDGGNHPDVVAQIFGYENGQHMLQEIVPYRKGIKDFVETEVATQLKAEFPELLESPELSEEAIKAWHNDNFKKMKRLELEYLAKNDPKVLKTVAQRLIRRMIPDHVVKEQARQILSKVPVREIRPHQYRLAERRFAREAADNYGKGEFALAFEAKQRELLNIELYVASVEAKAEVEKAVDNFKKVFRSDEKMAKSYDMNLVNVARASLAAYGLTRSEKTVEEYLAPIKRYDPQLFDNALVLLEQAMPVAGAEDYRHLTYGQFISLRDAVTALVDLARSSREMEIEGRKVNIDEIREELLAQAQKVSKDKPAVKSLGELGGVEKLKDSIHGMKASLVRIEHWADAMDVSFGGPFRKYVFQPVSDAITNYRLKKTEKLRSYRDLLKKYSHRLKGNKPIQAPELGSGVFFNNKSELIMAVLHSGNDSNLYKLLAGWGLTEMAEDGSFDRSAWDSFRARMYKERILTAEDMDLAQGVWDLMESMKPDTQKAHKKIMGFYFSEITANEIETPFGVYRGGYIPAKADPSKAVDANIREQKNAFDDVASAFSFPTTGRGATMARVERYAAPLLLNMSVLGAHLDWAMRFSYIEPVVRDAARVMMNRQFQTEMNKLDPHIINEAVIPWLQRAASQKVVEPSKDGLGRGLDTAARFLRSAVGRNIMFANIPNAMQQFTGVIIAAAKVNPKYLRNAMVRYISGPNQLALENQSKSDWLKSTQASDLFEIHQSVERIIVDPSTFEKFSDFSKKHAYFAQVVTQNIVNTVVWSGAYEQAISEGKTERESVVFADGAVRLTQGSMSPEDVSRFETGTATALLFKQFVGYFNMLANFNAFEAVRIAREMGIKKGKGKLFYLYLTGFMLPAVLSEAIMQMMSGRGLDDDDDDEYLDDLLKLFASSQSRTLLATVPYGGQTMVAAIDRFTKGPQGGRLSLSPVISTIDSVVGVPAALVMGVEKEELTKKGVRDALMAMGVITGLPVLPLSKPITYMMDVESGKANPSGPIDYTRGLITGRPGK